MEIGQAASKMYLEMQIVRNSQGNNEKEEQS